MKRKITLLLLAAASVFSVNSQVLFQEDFTSPFNPTGWSLQNLSSSPNTFAWFQGAGSGPNAVFPAFNGGPDDYVGCNFAVTSNTSTPQTLSSWLITPTLSIINGNVVEFATRTTTNPASFPDRLEVYLSLDPGTNVGATPTSVGTFSTLLVSVNPNLTATGYPGAWTVYQATITGVPAATVGRVGFRYFVTNGGPAQSATNSDYIGVDAFKYFSPCTQPTLSITQSSTNICSGNSVTLTANVTGTVSVSTYTWSNGTQNTTSIVVSPTATTVYTVSGTSAAGCVGSGTAAITVTLTPTVVVPSYTACTAASTTTLIATGATSYSWSTGATTNSVVVSPSTNTFYTVVGYGAGGNCPSNTATANITLSNAISVNITSNPATTTVCAGRTVTLSAQSAGTTYSWSSGQTVPTITVAPTVTTTYSVGAMVGTLPNVCVGGNSITINVLPAPSLSLNVAPGFNSICSGSDFTVTTTGAVTYTYVLSSTSAVTVNPIVLTAPSVNSITTTGFVVGGTGANGCVAAGQVTMNVNPNPTVVPTVSSPTVCTNNTVTLSGSGADTYQWSGASTSTNVPLTYSSSTAGNQTFTLTGTTLAGCTGSAAVSVSVVVCNTNTTTVGLTTISGYGETAIFPNPFSNEIKINVLDGQVVIYNALGQVVISKEIRSSETINTVDLPKGAYLVKAYNTSGELVKTVKLIKN